MNIVLDILIVGTATAAGFGTGWALGPGKQSAGVGDGGPWREELLQCKEKLAAALNDTANARNQAALAKSEAATFKLEAIQAKRDLEDALYESSRAHQALSQLQSLASRIAADVGQHNSRVQAISAELEQDKGDAEIVVAAVAQLLEANAKMHEQLESAEEKLKNQAEELQTHITEARTDALTGLFNRRAFDHELACLEEQFQKAGRPSSVMMVDVDHFKKFNDTYGHQAGDEVLRGVARVLKECVSAFGVVCRYGGEEFSVIFPGLDLTSARDAAERARASIADHVFEFEGTQLRVTASGGIAELTAGESAQDLVKRADEALYVCKEAGRNCGHYHDGHGIFPMTARLLETRSEEPAPVMNRDPLTGLSGKDALAEDLERRMAEWRRGGATVTLILVEIDKFDRLLNAFGQAAGDTMLKATAQFLKATMRDMDHVARWDQRRFALLLPSATRDDASGVAERLRNAIESCKLPVQGGVLQFTISVGITEVMNNDTTQSVIDRAGRLVLEASSQGGNRSVIAQPALTEAPK